MKTRASLIVAGVLAATAVDVQAVTINLDISDLDVISGESFSVDVIANDLDQDFENALDELIAFGFDVATTGPLSLTSATVGADFFDDSDAFADVDVAGSAFPGLSGVTSVLLATLEFMATGSGNGVISISTDLTNGSEGLIFSRFMEEGPIEIVPMFGVDAVGFSASLDVEVGEVVVTPLPSALALMLVGLVGLRRR